MTDTPETVIVRPWYRQFYLRRGPAEWRSDEISDEGYVGIEEVDGFVYVGTTMYGSPTRLSVRVHSSDPGPSAFADRVVEIGIGGDGDLDLLNWEAGEPPVARFSLPSGPLRARMAWSGMAAAAAHPDCEFSGDEISPERLVLDIWPMK